MKKRRGFLWILALLPLLISLDSHIYAQSTKNPDRDLVVSFSRETEGTEFGSVYGEVKNKSANDYPCVLVAFNLYAPFVSEHVWGRHLGVVSVEVRNVRPRSERKYSQPLPYMAPVIVHKSTKECSGGNGQDGTTPPPGVCTISVRVNEDRNTYQTTVQLLHPDDSQTLKAPRKLSLGRFKFIDVPEGKYKVIVVGKYPAGNGRSGGKAPLPRSQAVECRPNGSHEAVFKIDSIEG